ncbi:hypothetical protein G5714_003936 [Onychostoma macrolepis]|uniref:Interferon-induced very large GTPase 1 domain-containing protein n=1 Tax=Onychostoma macrolepis TaxID=369639 RepID=A0A7J6DAV7_9TELE|nr:hypothetical protein G5714_003936 [Onychostoma macrolepis]
MKMMMEEEIQNREKERKRREEELKREIREQEKHQKEIRDEMRQERETFRQEIEKMRQEKEKIKAEKEKLQIRYETEIARLMNIIENERQRHDKEREKREKEYVEIEGQYKTQIKEKDVKEREICDEMKRKREEWEKQKLDEKMRRQEEDEKRRKKDQRDWDEFNQRLKQEREKMEREKEDLKSKQEAKENSMNILFERMNREREELIKKHEEERERMKMMMVYDEQIQRLKSEMEGIIREKERIERERQKQLEELDKSLKEERNMKEDQQKTFEETLHIIQVQQEDELKRKRVEWREEYEREKEELNTICSETNDPLQVTAYRKLEKQYSKWSWSLRSAMLETENKLHNKIENETVHVVEETDLHRELKKTSEEVKKSMSEFFDKDTDADMVIRWKTSFEIKIQELQENIVSETKRKLNKILDQRDLKKKTDVQRTYNENTLYEKSKELAWKLKDKTNEVELKKEFDLFWEQSMKKIIKDTPAIKDIDVIRDAREILSDIYEGHLPVNYLKVSKDIFSVPSYSDYVKDKKISGFTRSFKDSFRSTKETLGYILSREDEAQIRALVLDVVQQTDKMIQSFNISKMGYNISYIQQLIGYIKEKLNEHEEGPGKYMFKKKFFIRLVLSICKRANNMITDQHRLFREANDPVIYVMQKKQKNYSIFQKHLHGAASAAIFGKIICEKLKDPIEQSVYKKTARDLADEMRSNCESLKGNRSNLEKHILKTLAEEEDFDKYMNYIHNPRDHFISFIRDEVSRYITDKFSVRVLPKMKENIKLLQQKIMKAAHESTEHVQVNSGDVGLWLKSFTQQLSDELIFSEKDLSGVKHDDVDDFKLLEDVIGQELFCITFDISSSFSTKTFPVKLDYILRPDELLIDHFCQCCWVQCPFCGATCTNTIENHHEDHSVAFHRMTENNGAYYSSTQNLCADICTNLVASDQHFNILDRTFKYRKYRKAGERFVNWSITPDPSELPYWKWFVCRFQKDLGKYYSKTFDGCGMIPDEWRKYSKLDAIESADQCI